MGIRKERNLKRVGEGYENIEIRQTVEEYRQGGSMKEFLKSRICKIKSLGGVVRSLEVV